MIDPPEVLALCAALARIPTVTVFEGSTMRGRASRRPVLVFFNIGELRWLYLVGRAIDRNYGGYGFRCELVTTDLPPHPVGFCLCTDTNDLRGPPLVGRPALEAAATLAARIDRLLSPELAHVRAHFGLTD